MSLLQNATCHVHKKKIRDYKGCPSYNVSVVIFVLGVTELDEITFFPTNCQNKCVILLSSVIVVALCSVYKVKLTYFSSWLHFKENKTNLGTMACTTIKLNQVIQSHPLFMNCPK
jgi:hypothetical protein